MLSCTRLQLLGLMMGSEEVMAAVHVDGDSTAPVRLVKYITPFSQTFNIVEPWNFMLSMFFQQLKRGCLL